MRSLRETLRRQRLTEDVTLLDQLDKLKTQFGPKEAQRVQALLALAQKVIATYRPPSETVAGVTYQTKVRTGIVVTSDEGHQADVAEAFHADLNEMESAAFARTCDILGVPCIVVRGGSNKPPVNGKDDDQSGYQGYRHLSPIAARDAALFGVHLIKYL